MYVKNKTKLLNTLHATYENFILSDIVWQFIWFREKIYISLEVYSL